MASILGSRLGVGGRYRAYPPKVPVQSLYFTLVFVRVGTVAVQDSVREVSLGSVAVSPAAKDEARTVQKL